MKKMLFNATHAEELRVAIVEGQKLVDLDLESAIRNEKKGNIYKGIITQVEPSLEACFVDYGAAKQGFLPLKEIYREYFNGYDSSQSISNVKIEKVIREKQEVIVQIDKDERGNKGAALTTFISLAGRFLVLMPNNPKGDGISRRIPGEHRSEIRNILSELKTDSRHSLIIRTESLGHTSDEIQWDLDFLTKLWDTIENASTTLKAPFLIYQESNLIVRSIRDYLSQDVAEIIVDDSNIYERSKKLISQVAPDYINKIKLYNDDIPLFSRYQIEEQINSAFNREVRLPSGGSISIDHTEALISIDVNSARATKGGDIEETALQTNLEGVEEIARQLRVRDIGGLIVIDLIDMLQNSNQRAVENRLRDAIKDDRARIQTSGISKFGLLEMSRQRLRSSISETNYRQCPRCNGTGSIRSVVSASLSLLRQIEDAALKENTEAVQVIVPLDMATYLLNEKRHELHTIESRLASRIIVIPTDELTSPQYNIKRLHGEQFEELNNTASFEQKIQSPNGETDVLADLKVRKPETPQVQLDHIARPSYKDAKTDKPQKNGAAARQRPAVKKPGLLQSLFGFLLGKQDKQPSRNASSTQRGRRTQAQGNRKHHNRNRRSGGGRENQNQHSRDNAGKRNPRQNPSSMGEKNPRQNQSSLGEKKPSNQKSTPRPQSPAQQSYSVPPGIKPAAKNTPKDNGSAPRSNRPFNKPKPTRSPKSANPAPYRPKFDNPETTADLPDDIGNRKD